MKIVWRAAFILLLSITAGWAAKKALIVSVPSHFQGELKHGIEIDTANMSNMLTGYGFEIEKLADESATTERLREKLREYQNMQSDDIFLLYYSGHGAQIPDNNGDENDGRDETIVLYDYAGDENIKGLFVDDEMFRLLVAIPAKKFVFFDSCHSGSAFKSAAGATVAAKSLGYLSKAVNPASNVKEPGEADKRSILFFGAAKDDQQSLATPSGSMFTLSLIDGIKRKKADSNHDGRVTFRELLDFSTRDIERQTHNCPSGYCPLFNPEMHAQKDMLDQDIFTAMEINDKRQQNDTGIEATLDKMLSSGEAKSMMVEARESYSDGDKIELRFDSGSYEGYLTVLYIDHDDITVLYPNRFQPQERKFGGRVVFPSSVTDRFDLNAMKPYGRTVGYVILSAEPLGLYEQGGKSIFRVLPRNGSAAKDMMRGMGIREKNTLMIGKAVFTVHGRN